MYKILLENEKNQFERSTKEELEKALLNLNGYFKETLKKENIKIYKTNPQGGIKSEIKISLPKEKDEISHCLEKFCLEKEEAKEKLQEEQKQETKLKNYNDNELDESDKDVYKNIINQDNEDITVEVTPSAKEKQKAIREQVEAKTKQEEKKEETQTKEEEKEQVNVQHQETKAKAEEIKEEKAEEIKTKQNQELLANSEKENIVYVPTNIKTANLIMCRNFERMLGETQGEIKKLEKIIEAYKKQIFELKKVEKRTNEMLETL